MAIKGEHLEKLIHILRFVPLASQARIQQQLPEIILVWQNAAPEHTRWQERWPHGLINYLYDQATTTVTELWEGAQPRAAQGLLLWTEYRLLPLIDGNSPTPDLDDLPAFWERLGPDAQHQLQQRYALPVDSWDKLNIPRTTAYRQMRDGCELLAQRLNPPKLPDKVTDRDWQRYLTAQRAWLEQEPDGAPWLPRYVPPQLREPQHPEKLLTPESVLDALFEQGIACIEGDAGWGKSLLLRYLGLRLLERRWAVVWLDVPVDVATLSYALLAKRWCAQLALAGSTAENIALHALRQGRLAVLVDGGEQWGQQRQREALVSWVRYEKGLVLVTTRPRTRPWCTGAWIGALTWSPTRLRRILPREGHAHRHVQLAQWIHAGILAARPWEYALAAQLPHTARIDSPLQLLETAFNQQWETLLDTQLTPQVAGKQRRALEHQAWHNCIHEQPLWNTPDSHIRNATQSGIQARLVASVPPATFRFVHQLWQCYLAARYAVTLEPEAVIAALIGVADWETVLQWTGLLALQNSNTDWVARLAAALTSQMRATPEESGWLVGGAVACGAWLRHPTFATTAAGQQLRQDAEAGLWQAWRALSTLEALSYQGDHALAQALTALAPWSPATADRLWALAATIDVWSSAVNAALLAQPQIATAWVNHLEQQTEIPQWAWRAIGRSGQIPAPALIQQVEMHYPGAAAATALQRVQAGVAALAHLGTAAAGRQLPRWLVEQARNFTGYLSRWEDLVAAELQAWQGSPADLWTPLAEWQFQPPPDACWRAYLRGACAATGSAGAWELAQLTPPQPAGWSLTLWEEICSLWRRYGDERLIPLLAQMWEALHTELTATPDAAYGPGAARARQLYLEATLWGSEGRGGLLEQQPTAWIIHWLQTHTYSPALRHAVVVQILQWRQDDSVGRLGRAWWRQAQRSQDLEGQSTALYLLPDIDPLTLDAALANPALHDAALVAAARLGLWDAVLPHAPQLLQTQHYLWEIHGRALQQAVVEWLPPLLEACIIGQQSELLLFGWGHYPSASVDRVLHTILAESATAPATLVEEVWALGTPGAVRQVLEWVQTGSAPYPYTPLPRHYRAEVWPLLADFVRNAGPDLEAARWEAFGAVSRLWPSNEPRPWAVTAFLFECLEDGDPDVREHTAEVVLRHAAALSQEQLWAGMEAEYVAGLRQWLLTGSPTQQRLALEWLAEMAAPAESALSAAELTVLLDTLPYPALNYCVVHQRREQAAALTARLTQWRATQPELFARAVSALGLLGMGADTLTALGHAIWQQGRSPWEHPAWRSLLQQPAHLKTLWTAAESGAAPRSWWVAALVEQHLLAQHEAGLGWFIRRGDRRIRLREWDA